MSVEANKAVTRRFGARLLLGAKNYDPPAAAATVPGPVLGLRRLLQA